MTTKTPRAVRQLAQFQRGVIARGQAQRAGFGASSARSRVRAGKWRRLHRGVYATFTGEPARLAVLWSALLRAGPDAMLSHQTAAELHGLIDYQGDVIHITVPAQRRVRGMSGVRLHRSRNAADKMHRALKPQRTTVEDTVLDLTQTARSFDDAFAWLSKAVGRRRTTTSRLLAALERRKKVRWRAEIRVALGDVSEGVHSLLEYRYVHRVERAHGLPAAYRQAAHRRGARMNYRDNLYEKYRVCVELDGVAAHPADERWTDIRRDNDGLAAADVVTFRFSMADVTTHSCRSAAQVAAALRRRGWTGELRRCGPDCRLTPCG